MKKLIGKFTVLMLSAAFALGAAIPARAEKSDIDRVQEYAESVIDAHISAAVGMPDYGDIWLSNAFRIYSPDGSPADVYICFVTAGKSTVGELMIAESGGELHSTFGSDGIDISGYIDSGKKIAFAANGKELGVCCGKKYETLYVDEFETAYAEMDGCAENLLKSGAKYSKLVRKYRIGAAAEKTYKRGWNTVGGKKYYILKNGEKAAGNTFIGGVCYTFDKAGVCAGKYTGWVKSGGKRFYCDDGVKQYGWVNVKRKNGGKVITGDWYYIDPKKGRLTGEQKLDGFTYKFDSRGRWDKNSSFTAPDGKKADNSAVAERVMAEMDKNAYGGVFLYDGMCGVWSVNGKAEKIIKEWYPGARCVMYLKADYSMNELEKAAEYFINTEKYPEAKKVRGMWASTISDDRLVIMTLTGNAGYMEALREYIDSLPCKDMIILREGGIPITE